MKQFANNMNINQWINFKSYWLNPYRGYKGTLKEAAEASTNYYKSSPFSIAWDKI